MLKDIDFPRRAQKGHKQKKVGKIRKSNTAESLCFCPFSHPKVRPFFSGPKLSGQDPALKRWCFMVRCAGVHGNARCVQGAVPKPALRDRRGATAQPYTELVCNGSPGPDPMN